MDNNNKSYLEQLKEELGEENPDSLALSAVEKLNFLVLELTAKGEEPCSLAKDPAHPGDNWVTEAGGLPRYICFGGNVKFLTKYGVRTFEETVGTTQSILVNTGSGIPSWIEAPIVDTGVQSLFKVVVKRNKKIKTIAVTPDHRWIVDHKRRVDRYEVVTTKTLQPGMRLKYTFQSKSAQNIIPSSIGIMSGFVFGDGTNSVRDTRATLFGDKDLAITKHLPPALVSSYVKLDERYTDDKAIQYRGFPRSWKDSYPDLTENSNFLLGWLAGYFAADGSIGEKTGTPILYSSSYENLRFVEDLCVRLGIVTYDISSITRAGIDDQYRPLYSITLRAEDLPIDFFIVDSHRSRIEDRLSRDNSKSSPDPWVVVSVENLGLLDQTYCAVVEGYENFTLHGNINVMNCNVAKHIKADGHTTSQAIAMAVSQIKKWIADPRTTAETKAKATAAIAEWEAKRAEAHTHATVTAAHNLGK